MKLIIRNNQIIGAVGDDYNGPEQTAAAPEGFENYRPTDFRVSDGNVVLDLYNVTVRLTQERLDGFAKGRGYDGILSACTYATSTVERFQIEGQKCVELRDATWSKLYDIVDEIQAQTRPMPESFNEIASELPALLWGDEPAPIETPAP